MFYSPGEGSCSKSSLPGKSYSVKCHCPQGPHTVQNFPQIVSIVSRPSCTILHRDLCFKRVFEAMRHAHMQIFWKNHIKFPNLPSLSSKPIWKQSLYFIVKFLSTLMKPQLTPVFSTSHFSLFFPPILSAHISFIFQSQQKFSFYKFIL